MVHFFADIIKPIESFLTAPVHPYTQGGEARVIAVLFDSLRNMTLCALVIGAGVWIQKHPSSSPTFDRIGSIILTRVGILLQGVNVFYFDLKLRELQVCWLLWAIAMALFIALSALIVMTLVMSKERVPSSYTSGRTPRIPSELNLSRLLPEDRIPGLDTRSPVPTVAFPHPPGRERERCQYIQHMNR